MQRRSLFGVCVLGLVVCFGCAGRGEVLNLRLQTDLPSPEGNTAVAMGPVVAVEPFEDLRVQTGRLGTRIDMWGGENDFSVEGGNLGKATAQVMADLLKELGWRAHLAAPGGNEPHSDVVVTGKIRKLSVDATGTLGSTEIIAESKVFVEAFNKSDRSRIRMTLSGTGVDEVFWFEPEDAQEVMNNVLMDSFAKLPANIKVEQKLLRLK